MYYLSQNKQTYTATYSKKVKMYIYFNRNLTLVGRPNLDILFRNEKPVK